MVQAITWNCPGTSDQTTSMPSQLAEPLCLCSGEPLEESLGVPAPTGELLPAPFRERKRRLDYDSLGLTVSFGRRKGT